MVTMADAPRDGTWIMGFRASGIQRVVSWMPPPKMSIFLGKESRWMDEHGRAGELPFDKLVGWRPLSPNCRC